MTEEDALKLVERAIGKVLGRPVSVTISTRRRRSNANRPGASSARVRHLDVRVIGWGTAFEAMRSLAPVSLDLDGDPDAMVRDVMKQAEALIDFQVLQSARAAAFEIEGPLDRTGFPDTKRLRIDIMAARLLETHCGSEDQVRAMVRSELLRCFDRRMCAAHEFSFEVHGRDVVVPVSLNDASLAIGLDRGFAGPVWMGSVVQMSLPLNAAAHEARREFGQALKDTVLSDRRLAEPKAPEIPSAWRRRITRDNRNALGRWTAEIEVRSVGFDEVFG